MDFMEFIEVLTVNNLELDEEGNIIEKSDDDE